MAATRAAPTAGTTAGTPRAARIGGMAEAAAPATASATTTPAAAPDSKGPSRPRRRRGVISRWAQPVYPIKAIWDAASEEERAKARELATELLGMWLGLQSKEDLAKRLTVPPIRVWQMSQRAVAGMVASMLRPPTGRRGAMPRTDPEVKSLRARIAVLERELSVSQRLVGILRSMPGGAGARKEAEGVSSTRTRPVRARSLRKARPPGTPPEPPPAAPAGG